MAEEREFGWDDEIENDSEFQILPGGDYNFTVTGFERGRHQGSAKLPPCNKAIITLNVADGKGNQGTIKHNLFLHTKTEGMLCAFFTAIGQRKHGEKCRMNWSAVVGATGRCKIGIHEYTSTKTGEVLKSNEIKKFYEPTGTQAEPTQSPASSFTPGSF